MNYFRTALLLAALTGFFLVAGYLLGGQSGLILALVVALGMNLFAYWNSDKMVLRMSNAQEIGPNDAPELYGIVADLAQRGGLPMPRVYIIDEEQPNAFATGRNPNHAAIAVTTGLLEKLNRVELEGVLAHELSHVKNYDILVSTLAIVMLGVITLLADLSFRFHWLSGHKRDERSGPGPQAILAVVGIVLIILGPIVARLIHFAISRRREQLADFSAVEMTRYPPGLISALEKLRSDSSVVRSGSRATAHMWIEDPMAQKPDEGNLARLNNLFNTHPPLADRIAALREL